MILTRRPSGERIVLSAGDLVALAGLIFAAALLYSSVGHAGASGYIAAMALFGLSPLVMKPTALTLNMLVAALACYRLHRAVLLRARALVPLLVGSVPMRLSAELFNYRRSGTRRWWAFF